MFRPHMGPTGLRLAVLLAAIAMIGSSSTTLAANPAGFRTSQASMLTPVTSGATATALITVGETLAGGYVFDSIPDGISIKARGQGRADLYINHETSLVPFPYNAASPTIDNSLNDMQNATVSRLIVNQHSGGILHGEVVIGSGLNYQRFCSNFLATAEHGFSRDILFTNEEATDFVYRNGTAWPVVAGDPAAEQAGVVVAHDTQTGQTRTLYGMGRLNHENAVAIPGFSELMIMSGDDTFTSSPAQSQVYAYFADTTADVWNDRGSLWGFRSTTPGFVDYYDFAPGSAASITGEFVEIPRAAAIGDQSALEAASDALDAFQFVRIEDIAYDRTNPNIVYLADTGRASTALTKGHASTNGRVWRMVLDPSNPRRVLSLSILIDGDTSPLGIVDVIHQPDNLETTAHGVFVTEDPSSANRFPVGSPTGTPARVWWYHLDGPLAGTKEVAFRVDQSADEGPTDVDPSPTPALWGDWEASGIVDASAVFGPGAFLVDVQAHSLFVEVAPGPDLVAPAGPDWLYKREGGQLLLVRIPGA